MVDTAKPDIRKLMKLLKNQLWTFYININLNQMIGQFIIKINFISVYFILFIYFFFIIKMYHQHRFLLYSLAIYPYQPLL